MQSFKIVANTFDFANQIIKVIAACKLNIGIRDCQVQIEAGITLCSRNH